jgi:AcrR family transcriptional regulator
MKIIPLSRGLCYNSSEMAEQPTWADTNDAPATRSRGRPKGAEATRARILDAAASLIVEGGYQSISLDDIAQKAGFSRRTIYDQFGSKRGVLVGILERIAGEGLPELLAAVRQAKDPVEALEKAMPLSVAYTDRYVNIVRVFYAQAVNDPDFRAAWEYAQQNRWDNLHRVAQWLAREGRLAEGWSVERATDWLHSLTSFRLHDELVVSRGWSLEEMAAMMMRDIRAVLLAPSDRSADQRGTSEPT